MLFTIPSWPSKRKSRGNPLNADARAAQPSPDGNFFACAARKLLVSFEQRSGAHVHVRTAFKGSAPKSGSSPLNVVMLLMTNGQSGCGSASDDCKNATQLSKYGICARHQKKMVIWMREPAQARGHEQDTTGRNGARQTSKSF